MALVFYPSEEDDRKIIEKVSHLNAQSKAFLLSASHFSWVRNRFNKETWVEIARADNIPWADELTKMKFLNAIVQKRCETSFFGFQHLLFLRTEGRFGILDGGQIGEGFRLDESSEFCVTLKMMPFKPYAN